MNNEERKYYKQEIENRVFGTLEQDLRDELSRLKEGWTHNPNCASAKEDYRNAKKRNREQIEKFKTLLAEISA